MRQADEIWFASAWDYWQAHLIKKSFTNATNFARIPIKVFGKKDFGRVDIKSLLSKSNIERRLSKGLVSALTIKTNELLKESLPADVFIDVQDYLCGSKVEFCSLFDDEGNLISYDGSHLTYYGAKLLGSKLVNSSLNKYFAEK